MRFSVILPIYQAEATIHRCLDHLLSQPHENVEILLINDGSTDDSDAICRAYAEKHSCIRYFSKSNGGVSSARNLGLQNACGEYILFVDSDDYVSEHYFQTLNQALDRTQPDLLLFGYQNFGIFHSAWHTGSFILEDQDEIAEKVSNVIRQYLFSSLWSKAFRRTVISSQNLQFSDSLSIGEDHAFIIAFVLYAMKVQSIEDILYYVSTENPHSLSRKYRHDLTHQLLEASAQMSAALECAALPKRARGLYQGALAWVYYRSAYSSCKELYKQAYTRSVRREKMRQICSTFRSNRVMPLDWKCWMIALPIRLNAVSVVDALCGWSDRKRKRQT